VTAENPSARVTMNCKLCKTEIALYRFKYEVILSSVNKSSHPIQTPSTVTSTRNNIMDLYRGYDNSKQNLQNYI
jgi:hypothetical protein